MCVYSVHTSAIYDISLRIYGNYINDCEKYEKLLYFIFYIYLFSI